MMLKVYELKSCTTCKKAIKTLDEHDIPYERIDIRENPPTMDVLTHVIGLDDVDLDRMLNKRGNSYKELGLKEKLSDMAMTDVLKLMASDGMLIKRPFVYDGEQASFGFKESEFTNKWLNQ